MNHEEITKQIERRFQNERFNQSRDFDDSPKQPATVNCLLILERVALGAAIVGIFAWFGNLEDHNAKQEIRWMRAHGWESGGYRP